MSEPKTRLDDILVDRGFAESRAVAQSLIMAGQVRVDGQVCWRPAAKVAQSTSVEVEHGPRFVSRGGEKLDAALQAFAVRVEGQACADVGASTGGFTDCLLQAGASKVYAIDVGYGILHWKLRQDARVVVMERTNARHLASLPEPVSLAVIDASFISLKTLLPVVKGWLATPAGQVIALVKPQFEAGREEASRGEGVIQDPQVHRKVLREVLKFAERENFVVCGLIASPLKGPKGNVEFLVWLRREGESPQPLEAWIDSALR